MRFKQFLNKIYEVVITDGITNPINELTSISGGDVEVDFQVPKINKEKYRKLNKKTNRMKNFKKIKYFKTDIKPIDRSFKNLPRYANKKPICRFQDWLEIKQDSEFSKKGASGGKASNGKWYGYSHRAVYGFEPGLEIKKGHIAIYPKRPLPYKIKDDNDAKWHAIQFSREVS